MSVQNSKFVASVFKSSGVVTINGENIPYDTVCQDNVLHDELGEEIASMFTYSYFRSDVEDVTSRPVVFFFNGGPGSSSIWLHAGVFGPIRMTFENPEAVNVPHVAPYYAVNNDLCLLDKCDLVFIDPVGTGWGRLLKKEAASRFYGLDEDAESFRILIDTWVSRHKRWYSPKYLLGESYGTVRAGLLSDKLGGRAEELVGVGIDGIILLGNAMGNTGAILEFDAEPSLLALPTMAAAHWYHHKLEGSLEDFVNKCYQFCENEYVLALFKGTTIDDDEREKIAEKVAYFSGLSKKEILKQNLRPDMTLSWQQLLEDEGLEIGRLDGRYTRKFGTRSGKEGVAITQYTPAFMATMCGPIKENLGIDFEREYYAISSRDGFEWNEEKCKHLPHECLSASMNRNYDLRVMFATGYYDMACQIGQARYLATHGGYPMDRIEINEYPSGHMAYLGEESAKAFVRDVRNFIK
ncbi:MAG: hypothetical protein R3Y57_03345 [Erysipelotrichaceae bacterium]